MRSGLVLVGGFTEGAGMFRILKAILGLAAIIFQVWKLARDYYS